MFVHTQPLLVFRRDIRLDFVVSRLQRVGGGLSMYRHVLLNTLIPSRATNTLNHTTSNHYKYGKNPLEIIVLFV